MVGAAGLTPGNAWVRGVGEAVERFALSPSINSYAVQDLAGVPKVMDELAAHGLVGDLPSGTPVLPAVRLATGEPCAVPQTAIDYPATEDSAVADQTPSGAASGLDADRPLVRAALELVERDAFERAWQGVTVPRRIELVDLARETDAPTREALAKLQDVTRRHNHQITLGWLPTINGVPAVTALVQRGDGPVGVGCSAGGSVAACAVKAAVEGIQVESLLRNWRDATNAVSSGDRTSPRPRTEFERLDYLCSASATKATNSFGESFDTGRLPEGTKGPTTSGALAAQLAGLGVQLFAVDLTPRLPVGVRGRGWHAVRVLAAGLQPLRGNDLLPWNWNLRRMEGRVGPRGQTSRPPHPLA